MTKRHRLPLLLCTALLLLSAFPAACLAAVKCRVTVIDGGSYKTDSDNLVRITDGQYLVAITGERHNPSFIITPTSLIRCSSGNLIVQVSARRCQIAVVSGSAVVKNLIDRHIIELHRGTVYSAVIAEQSAVSSPVTAGQFDLISQRSSLLPLFASAKCHSFLASLSQSALAKSRFASRLSAGTAAGANARFPDAEIISPPTIASYRLGEQLAHDLPMPALMRQNFPPDGLVSTPASSCLSVAEQAESQD